MKSKFADDVWDDPTKGLIALLAAQTVLWFLAPALSHSAPPLDVVEMYAWGREGVVATFKHPNLPGLVLEAVRRVTGQAFWPAFLVSQIFIAVTFWAVFGLGRELMDSRRALAGTLLLCGIYFFSWPTPEFNHNVAQMPLWALIALFLWRSVERGKLLDWILLGLFAGLSLWAKYSSLMLIAPAGLWLLFDAKGRATFKTPGPYLALLAFVAVAAPQAVWLLNNDFAPFTYAAERSGNGGPVETFEFLALEIANCIPLLLIAGWAGFFGKRTADEQPSPAIEKRTLAFLLALGVGPLLLTLLIGIAGSGMRTSWGAPMLNLAGLLAVALQRKELTQRALQRIGAGATFLLAIVPAIYFVHMRFGADFTGKPLKGNWPQAEMTRQLETRWAEQTHGAPLRIVAGDVWTAGLVGLRDRTPPSVFIDADPRKSPWVSADRLKREGVLVVWRAGSPPPARYAAMRPIAEYVTIPNGSFPKAKPLELSYLIIPPEQAR